jgi:hypothetical protein
MLQSMLPLNDYGSLSEPALARTLVFCVIAAVGWFLIALIVSRGRIQLLRRLAMRYEIALPVERDDMRALASRTYSPFRKSFVGAAIGFALAIAVSLVMPFDSSVGFLVALSPAIAAIAALIGFVVGALRFGHAAVEPSSATRRTHLVSPWKFWLALSSVPLSAVPVGLFFAYRLSTNASVDHFTTAITLVTPLVCVPYIVAAALLARIFASESVEPFGWTDVQQRASVAALLGYGSILGGVFSTVAWRNLGLLQWHDGAGEQWIDTSLIASMAIATFLTAVGGVCLLVVPRRERMAQLSVQLETARPNAR